MIRCQHASGNHSQGCRACQEISAHNRSCNEIVQTGCQPGLPGSILTDMDNRYRQITRRVMLKSGSAISAVAGIRRALAADAPSPLMTAVSTYMSEAGSRKLPDAVIEKAKQMILDTFAAMISGSDLPPGRFAIN